MPGPPVEMLGMEDDEDYLLRPVLKGLCRFESLRDGTVTLADIALMHESLDIQAENEGRMRKYMEAVNGR